MVRQEKKHPGSGSEVISLESLVSISAWSRDCRRAEERGLDSSGHCDAAAVARLSLRVVRQEPGLRCPWVSCCFEGTQESFIFNQILNTGN